MKDFVIVKKTMKDVDQVKDPYADILNLLPKEVPHECNQKRYVSLAAAKADNPGLKVMTVEKYNADRIKMVSENKHVFDAIKLRTKELELARKLDKVAP